MTHICLCNPLIIGLLPITCYNNKLSKNHLETTINKITKLNKSKPELNVEESIKH